ncbi:ABC-type Mn/Zn transport systems ATPase component [Rubrobacter radiotolerans]|uniref:ABC-type Mn/Zn transport systems ATPase component n=1 Tax=Rubrobacter radiotolerans TaxID=42256 RepID=A0A023X236_RUBRA|nr:metal ABC transporter ATP-binding protein [Rubrobacter radiotolerans]AHY46418.1 ABC-type Mn/Zn transport systems ATPase component [Rubrobacter radiotolerans]MDX5893825.1 metal ABC transporter ATP-binding protein [Rubrobacter radiotolerans]SMC04574.1 manganese/zinc/iron transport system ATP-binding protein [Rubrobacter radiotolerans DSM 5868]
MEAAKNSTTDAPLVRVKGLSAGYGGEPAIVDLDFEVGPGVRVGVLGQNGGGKSTLFKVLLGDLAPYGGEIELPYRCGTVPQTERSRLDYPVTALDVALMGYLGRLPWWRRPGRRERREALEALARVGLAEKANARFGTLSGGQRQRVLVARALVQDARLLLLDEPFSGLDSPSAELLDRLIERLAEEGRSVMIATHDLDQARSWDLVLCLNKRQIAFGAPGDVLTREVIEATYGAQVTVINGGRKGEPGERRRGLSAILPPHHHRDER